MIAVRLSGRNDFAEWRDKARRLLRAGLPPRDVAWHGPGEENGLFEGGEDMLPEAEGTVGSVPAAFLEIGAAAICHADPERFALLYRFLWRLVADRQLIAVLTDPDLARLQAMAGAVRRDSHKMKAFVRFRQIAGAGEREAYLAWFEPDHFVLERTAPFFARRFSGMDWGIVTPYRSAFWNGAELEFGPGGHKGDVPAEDAREADWRTYYGSIFNPARLKVAMMKSEMPVKYWRNLPEAELIPSLIRNAETAEAGMIERAASEPPARHRRQQARQPVAAEPEAAPATLAEARSAIDACRRCPLYENATQAVFGEGPDTAEIVFVGEQPGDSEDLAGRPFVGPAGKVFNESLERVGIDRSRVYVTNAVKHFKFTPRGKRRLHQKPDGGEIAACRFWLDIERKAIGPRVIVALGATAAQSLLGRSVTISRTRGTPLALEDGTTLFVTNHPSYILRIPDRARAGAERARFEADLAAVRAHLMAA